MRLGKPGTSSRFLSAFTIFCPMIRLSLIIATYNRSAALVEALRSVVRQDFPAAEWECIVVNNNSQDDTLARFEAFATEHPAINLRIVTETRQGLSHARNRGIDESRGEYIAIIDDDERINEQFISSYVALFDAYPDAASAGGPIIPEYPAGRPAWMSSYTERPIANPIDLGRKIRPFPKGRIPGGGNMALRRSTVQRYGAFDPSLGRTGEQLIGGEESDLFQRLADAGERCYYVPTAIMWHIIPPRKISPGIASKSLCYQVGRTQRLRAGMRGQTVRLLSGEAVKWGATLLLALGFLLRFSVPKARYLLLMRRQITRGNIGSKTVRRRLGALPVKIPVASLQTGIRKFAVQICSPDAGLAAQSRTYVSAIPVKQAAKPQTIVRTSIRRRNIFIYVSHATEACRAYAPVGDVYGASELFCEADAAVHENGAPKANSGDEGNGRHTR